MTTCKFVLVLAVFPLAMALDPAGFSFEVGSLMLDVKCNFFWPKSKMRILSCLHDNPSRVGAELSFTTDLCLQRVSSLEEE